MIFAALAAIAVATSVASFAFSYYQQKRAERLAKGMMQSSESSELSTPTTDAGKLIPVVFGTRQISGAFLAWFDKGQLTVDGKEEHTVNLQLAICYGPVDEIKTIYLDDRTIWYLPKNILNGGNNVSPISLVSYPFSDGGKFSGDAILYGGGLSQITDSWLRGKIGFDVNYPGVCGMALKNVNVGTSANLRSLSFKIKRCPSVLVSHNTISQPKVYHDIWLAESNSTQGTWTTHFTRVYKKTDTTNVVLEWSISLSYDGYSFTEVRFCDAYSGNFDSEYFASQSFAATKTASGSVEIPYNLVGELINVGVNVSVNSVPVFTFPYAYSPEIVDANPAAIICESLANDAWGLNLLNIGRTSFNSAGETLYSEGFGISVKWEKSSTIKEFIKQVLAHIDGVLYTDRADGMVKIKLLRNDYNVLEIPSFDESTIESVNTWKITDESEMQNTVTVTYYDSSRNVSAGVTVSDPVLVGSMGMTVSTTLDFPGITNKVIALRVAKRELAQVSNPLIATSFTTAFSNAANLYQGDAIRVSFAKYSSAPVIFRVQKIDFGDGKKNSVTITATQDIYSLTEMQ